MSDLLLDIGQNPRARRLVQSLGLPISLPQKLRRARGPYEERELFGRTVVVGGCGALAEVLADVLARAGADPHVVGEASAVDPYRGPGEAFGRPPVLLAPGEVPEGIRADALVFDGCGVDRPEHLRVLHEFFHGWIDRLDRCGRIVVLGRPPEDRKKPAAAAASAALEGFTRSLAKEIGKTGATANLVYVADGAEDRLQGLLRFLLSDRSVYVTAQPFRVSAQAKSAEATPSVRPLDGRVALVTGAARGIGAATAELLAAEGAKVVVLDRPEDDGPASRVARSVGGSLLLVDVTDPEAPGRIADDLRERHGGVDIVVHNAGITRDKTLRRMTIEQWDQAVDVNLSSVARITDTLLEGPLRDGGRIICLSSIAGIAGNVGQTNYAASKSGLVGWVAALARRTAKHGITVNAIAPGFIETRLTAAMPMMLREAARRLCALGQGGLPEDVGQTIAFLATPGAHGLTGQVVRVCGGALVGR